MAHELEYVTDNALLDCTEGTVPQFFHPTPRNIRIQGLKVANASDKTAFTNIPSFVICKKLSQQSGYPVPCVPAPQTWRKTYPVKINQQELLVFRSCIKCSTGQGTIEFMTSGQTPVGAADLAQLQELQKEADEALKEAEAEKNSVGEAGFAEGLIPIWGSGRDMIHSAQTGHWGMAALNAGFLAMDVVGVVGGLFTFGGATALEMGAKTGLKAMVEAGAKVAVRGAAEKLAQLSAKALLAKGALKKAMLKLAETRVCVIACFPAGTLVSTEAGPKPIEAVQRGERVWSRHEQTGELALKPVVTVMQRESDHLVHLRLGGERISTTVEHPFWVKDKGWTKAGELQLDDLVQRADGAAVAVSQIEHQTEFENDQLPVVYNIEVAEWHSYLVGKWMWWVHNATICLWTAAKAGAKYAQDILRGIKFNKTMEKRMADGVHELWVDGMKARLDTLIPGKKIISRKATQLGEVSEATAKKYIDELVTKYEKGKTIQNPKRAGGATKLEGEYTLQVPRQDTPIPQSIKDYAKANDVTIEEVKDVGMGDLKNW